MKMMMVASLFPLLFAFTTLTTAAPFKRHSIWRYRGGSSEELTLEQKVQAAMKKLGIQPVAPTPDDEVAASSILEADPSSETESTNKPASSKENAGTAIHVAEESTDAISEPVDGDGVIKVEEVEDSLVSETTSVSQTNDVASVEEESRSAVSEGASCTADGVCTPPPKDPATMAYNIADDMGVDPSLAWAALGATSEAVDDNSDQRIFNEDAARSMLQQELDMIRLIPDDAEEVNQLLSEGHKDRFLVRRALAFAERNVDDARAILLAEEEEEEEPAAAAAAEEEEVEQEETAPPGFKTLNVEAGFDPTALGSTNSSPASPPAPARRESVVFEATTADVFDVVLRSPVPVLLDIYADWCGPCKTLSPILEEMAIKSGGAFRLVKVNTDNERAVSAALDVTSLPTVFGVRDGKIVHMFMGMPKSEEMMKNFMMGLLVPGEKFNPPVTDEEQEKYDQMTSKLIKTAAASSYPFGARERLQERTTTKLDELVEQTGDIFDAEASTKIIRSLLSNTIKDPFDPKFRSINLENKVVQSKIAKYPAALAILKSVGFSSDSPTSLGLDKAAKLVNTAPLTVARDAIDKWIDKKRYEVAKAARKRRDEADRVQVQAELVAAKAAEEKLQAQAAEETEEEVDPNLCTLKLRLEGKKKVHEVVLDGNEPLGSVLTRIPGFSSDDSVTQIMCAAKRLVVKSTDNEALQKSLREHNLFPAASLVIKPVGTNTTETTDRTTRSKRARKKLKKGSHTMQSIGIYAKDDGAKGELIDGGGGVMYEMDVSDNEEEEAAPTAGDEDEPQEEDALDDSADDES